MGITKFCSRIREYVASLARRLPFTEASCGYVGVNDGWTDLPTTIASMAVSRSARRQHRLMAGWISLTVRSLRLASLSVQLCTMR